MSCENVNWSFLHNIMFVLTQCKKTYRKLFFLPVFEQITQNQSAVGGLHLTVTLPGDSRWGCSVGSGGDGGGGSRVRWHRRTTWRAGGCTTTWTRRSRWGPTLGGGTGHGRSAGGDRGTLWQMIRHFVPVEQVSDATLPASWGHPRDLQPRVINRRWHCRGDGGGTDVTNDVEAFAQSVIHPQHLVTVLSLGERVRETWGRWTLTTDSMFLPKRKKSVIQIVESIRRNWPPALTTFNQPALTSFNQPALTSFNQPALTSFNQPALIVFNQPALTSFNQPALIVFNQPALIVFNQLSELFSFRNTKINN